MSERLADMACGYLDGRKGIPEFSEPAEPKGSLPPYRPDGADDDPDSESMARAAGPWPPGTGTDPPAKLGSAPEPIMPLQRIRTPRIDAIIREANELIETERCQVIEERVLLRQQLTQHQITLDSSAKELLTTTARLEEAQVGLTSQQLEQRRLAETDQGSRPVGLVMARRRTAWDGRRASAEDRHQAVTTRATQAEHEARLCRDLIADREETARAAARRHHELAHRRIATYLQQLVRSHPQGRKLNGSLIEFRVGPELPEWAREPSTFRSRAEPGPGDDAPPDVGLNSQRRSERQ
jgi:hypothetical protein